WGLRRSEERLEQVDEELDGESAGSSGAPVEKTPYGGVPFHTEENHTRADIEVFEHLLVEGADFSFQHIRDGEALGGSERGSRFERDLHLPSERSDLEEVR